jgi:hypothetical protein
MPTAFYNASQSPFARFASKSLQKFLPFDLTTERIQNIILTGAPRMRTSSCVVCLFQSDHIVNVDGSPVVQFSHFSVKEFLMSSRLANAGEHLSLYHILLLPPTPFFPVLASASFSVLVMTSTKVQ